MVNEVRSKIPLCFSDSMHVQDAVLYALQSHWPPKPQSPENPNPDIVQVCPIRGFPVLLVELWRWRHRVPEMWLES